MLALCGCVIDELDLRTKTACPCAPGYECVRNVCHESGTPGDVMVPGSDGGSQTDAGNAAPVDVAMPEDGGTGADGPPSDASTADDASLADAAGASEMDASTACPTPTPSGACPTVCNGGCTGGQCIITCDYASGCSGGSRTCPPGWACRIECNISGECGAGTMIQCADGPCELVCGAIFTCQGAKLACGTGACAATCSSGIDAPDVICGPSCDCTGVCR